MKTLALLFVLASCNQWIRSTPQEHHVRNPSEQRAAAVYLTMDCYPFSDTGAPDPFDPTAEVGETRHGWGVLVSDWQVLTALHVVDCQSTIAQIYAWREGTVYRFAPEKEWRDHDVARIQLATAESVPSAGATVARRVPPVEGELLYLQVERAMLAESLGGSAYRAPTERGDSGAGVYDMAGRLVGVHIGTVGDYQIMARVQGDMVP